MATGGEEKVGYSLANVGTLTLEKNTDKSPFYISIVVCQDKMVVIDFNARKVQMYRLHDGKFLATSNRLEVEPRGMCLMDAMQICVLHVDGLIKIISISSTDMPRDLKTNRNLRLQGVLDRYHDVFRFKDTLVVSGAKQGSLYWCIVSLDDGHVDKIHQVCKGDRWSCVTSNDDNIYVSCDAGYKFPNNTGVYGFDSLNPSQCKYTYKHKVLQRPTSIVINEEGNIFVANFGFHDCCIHQLTASCQLVAIFTQGFPRCPYAMFCDHGCLYVTRLDSSDITVFQPVYQESDQASEVQISNEQKQSITKDISIEIGQGKVEKGKSSVETELAPSVTVPEDPKDKQDPIIPVEILRMDNESLLLYKEALQDGKEKVYNIRVMVVGQFGVGKTTLTKRLLGQQVDISERKSTEGIDVYKHCCKIALDTGEWTVQYTDTEHNYQLQRLARFLIEKQSMRDGFADEEEFALPSPRERTSDCHASITACVTYKEQVKMDPENEMLIPGSNANVTDSIQVIHPQDEINPDVDANFSDKETGNMDPIKEQLISETNGNVAENIQDIIHPQKVITPERNEYVVEKEQVDNDPMRKMLTLLRENTVQLKQDEGKVSPLSVWDFAGQYPFYTTHQTFLTRRAIYLLVSDISGQVTDIVDDECFFDSEGITKCRVHEMIDVWLNSIHSCAPSSEAGIPPVILVGTNVDKINQIQRPLEGKELEIQTPTPATEEVTLPTTSLPAAASTREHASASTIFHSMKKIFTARKTKKTEETSPISSMTGVRSIPFVDQPKKKSKWPFWKRSKKERFDVNTEKACKDKYSTPIELADYNYPETLIALYDYTRGEPKELSISKGDELVLVDISLEDFGWWEVRNSTGEVGLVPVSFVQRGSNKYSTTAGLGDHNNPETLIALYDYTRCEPEELSISKGEELILVDKSLEHVGWWKVRNSLGRVGRVPISFVQSSRYELCMKYFREIRSYLRDKPTRFHLVDEDFAIDNTIVDHKLEDLRRKIVEVASQQPYWGEEIPVRWLPLEQELIKLKAAGIQVIPFTLLEDLNKAGAVPLAADELDLFLRFHHDIGTILYFSLEVLKEHIVLDPQWMINALKSLITAEEFILKSALAVLDKWYKFKQKGKLYPELIDAVWSKKNNPDFHNNKEHILRLMERLNIIAKPRYYSEDRSEIKEESYFLAPCMLSERTPTEVISLAQHPEKGRSSVLCYVFQGKFLPAPIFHRLLATCVAHWPIAKKMSENLIFCGSCVFNIDLHHTLTMFFRDYVIFLQVTRMGATEKNPSSKLCSDVQKFTTLTLSSIIGHLGQSLRFDLFIQCPQIGGYPVDCLIPVKDFKGNVDVPCHFHDTSHIIMSCDVLKFWFQETEQSADGSSASSTPNPPTSDTDRFMCIAYLLNDVGSKVLRKLFHHMVVTPTCTLDQHLVNNRSNIDSLLKKRVLNPSQINIMFPSSGADTNLNDCDITLLSALLNNIVPSMGHQEMNLVKGLRDDRNKLYGHTKSCMMNASDFQTCWSNISSTLITLSKQCGDSIFENEILKEIQQTRVPDASYLSILQTWFSRIERVEQSLKSSQTSPTS